LQPLNGSDKERYRTKQGKTNAKILAGYRPLVFGRKDAPSEGSRHGWTAGACPAVWAALSGV
jgi:hypothetical protein